MSVEARAVDRLKALRGGGLPLPENCRVRLVDLPVTAGGMISVDETGFVNIYINARLSRDAQREALQHELRHHYRGDLFSDADIRTVEAEADATGLYTIDGRLLDGIDAAFDPDGLRCVGRGLYRPTGMNRRRAEEHILGIRALLKEACRIYDVMQSPPLLKREALEAAAGALDGADIAFVAWQLVRGQPRAMLHFSRENLYGAVYYAPDGAIEGAVAAMCLEDMRVFVDVHRRGGRLEVCRITREIDERLDRIY